MATMGTMGISLGKVGIDRILTEGFKIVQHERALERESSRERDRALDREREKESSREREREREL